MFGGFLDAVMQIPKNMHAEEMQDDAQTWSSEENDRAKMFNAAEAEKAREFNSAQAVAARDWSERLSNTQHQRGVADLRAAGLNPIMAATRGMTAGVSGASSASGAAASGPSGGGGGTAAGSSGNTFTQGEINSAHSNLMRQQAIVATQQGYNVSADTTKKEAERDLSRQQIETEKQRTNLMRNQASASAKDVARAETEAEIDSTTYGKIMRYIDRLRGGSSAYRNFTPN